ELHRRALDDRLLDVLPRTEGLVDRLAGLDLAELGPHHRAALARLVVVPLDDLLELAVDEQGHAVLEVVRRDHVRSVDRGPGLVTRRADPAGCRSAVAAARPGRRRACP